MIDINEIRLVLIVGLHTVVNALAIGEMQRAVTYMLYAVACYFLILGSVWAGTRVFNLEKPEVKTKPRIRTARTKGSPAAKRKRVPDPKNKVAALGKPRKPRTAKK